MLKGNKIIVVMPAYNAARTLSATYHEVPHEIVDEVIMVDDNRGYGGNQKTCYTTALERGADIVIMLHPDYQYTPKLITAMASLICEGLFDCVLGSRILGVGALKGGMPYYKYLSNRLLTLTQNILLGYKLSEYHTGYRAFRREILESLPLQENSDDFLFDNQMLAQIIYAGYSIDSSSINFSRSVVYGLGVIKTSLVFRLNRWKILHSREFQFKR
jgi:glycosyltransferase involved in cell wall biosynthesis